MPIRLRDRDPIYTCWRVAAIRRCVTRYGKSYAWAREKLREIAPDGSRDQMLAVWFPGRPLPLTRSEKRYDDHHAPF